MNKIEFVHLHKADTPKGGCTIAMECNELDEVQAIAVANCSKKDNFNRKIGRQKSQGRLLSPRYRVEMPLALPRREYIKSLFSTLEL